ncbi:MAG: hypothetical protein ACFE9V_19960 [Candidatus Hodarchaeota archaeon]
MYFSHKPDFINNITGFGTLFFVYAHILLFIVLMNQDSSLRSGIIPLWLLTLSIPVLLIVILILLSSLLKYGYKRITKRDRPSIGKKLEEKKKVWSKAKKDSLRKLNHVLIFIGLVVVWYVGLFIIIDYTDSSTGMIPEENNTFLLYLKLIDDPNSITEVLYSLGWFYYLLFFFFYVFSLFMLANEFARKTKGISFPFTFFTRIYLDDKEQQNYGTYLYFAIGQMFAAFVCPPMVFFTILGISSISDLMTSQIGIRFGKTHITWNRNKTWEGTIAGTLITLLICYLFMGIFWSLIFTLAFLTFDIFTNKPINLSDNLLIPIGCSLIYLFIRFFFNLDYYTVILSWI